MLHDPKQLAVRVMIRMGRAVQGRCRLLAFWHCSARCLFALQLGTVTDGAKFIEDRFATRDEGFVVLIGVACVALLKTFVGTMPSGVGFAAKLELFHDHVAQGPGNS